MSLTTDQVKQIAEYMGLQRNIVNNGCCNVVIYADNESGMNADFEPLEHEWKSRIFDRLVDECDKKHFVIKICSKELFIKCNFLGQVWLGKFNNESICLALIAVMESK